MSLYDYPTGDYGFHLEPIQDKGRYRKLNLTFKSAFHYGETGSERVQGEYYYSKLSDCAPLIIIAHGMGDSSLIPARWLALSLVKKGWAAYLPYLPIHSSRTPKIVNPLSISSDGWFDLYIASVVELRQAIDWATGRGNVDPERLVITGISFGGFISAITMAVDRRLKAGITIESGGNASKINHLSPTMRRRYGRIPVTYEEEQRQYRSFLAQAASEGIWQTRPSNRHFLTDPLTFAPLLRGRPFLMINGYFDALIPRAAASEMAQAAGLKSPRWLPAGHLSLWLWYPLIRQKVQEFLATNIPASY